MLEANFQVSLIQKYLYFTLNFLSTEKWFYGLLDSINSDEKSTAIQIIVKSSSTCVQGAVLPGQF